MILLTIHDFANATYEPWPGSADIPDHATWLDARSPTKEEIAFLQRALHVTPPTLERMSEIESTSRLYRMKDAVCLTLPLPHRDPDGTVGSHPLALIVTPKALLTVRYQDVKPCDPEFQAALGVDRSHPDSIGATIAVLESIIDHLADELEGLTARLDANSKKIFAKPTRSAAAWRGQMLKDLIPEIGRQREYSSLLEEALLTLSRAAPFLQSELGPRLTPETRARLDRIDRDVASLNAHEGRLADKAQFMLDASLGLIGVEQNDIFKVLTIVSVIGIPPTLIASMYGMNFKNIPEYDWTWGYQYGLALIFTSALLPLLWFKWKRWW